MWSLARTVYRYPACTACIQFSCKWVIMSWQLKFKYLHFAVYRIAGNFRGVKNSFN